MRAGRLSSVIVRRTAAGQTIETVRIANDPMVLAAELAKAGPEPEVVLEAHPADQSPPG